MGKRRLEMAEIYDLCMLLCTEVTNIEIGTRD